MEFDNRKTKKCSNCGAVIPKDAIYCDICGAVASKRLLKQKQKIVKAKARRKKKRNLSPFIKKFLRVAACSFAVLIILAGVTGYVSDMKYKRYLERRDLSDWETIITPEKIEKIDIGMTYDEVVEIVGGEGKLIDDSKYWETYAWPGENYIPRHRCYAEIEFGKDDISGDKLEEPPVYSIYEHDMLDGAESEETYRIIHEREYSRLEGEIVTREQVDKITEGMTYEKACEVLGSEGKLYRSSRWQTKYRTSEEKEYVWKCKNDGRDYYYMIIFSDGIIRYYGEWRNEYVD